MALSTTQDRSATLPPVTDDEPAGVRVKRERQELGWRQKDLAAAAGVKPETVSNIERELPAARGERPSVALLLSAMEAERQARASGAPESRDPRQLVEFLSTAATFDDMRLRRIGRHRKVRYLTVAIPDPDATPEQIQQDLEDFHREQRRHDEP